MTASTRGVFTPSPTPVGVSARLQAVLATDPEVNISQGGSKGLHTQPCIRAGFLSTQPARVHACCMCITVLAAAKPMGRDQS